MNEETRKWLAILSFTIALILILFLFLSGFEISNIEFSKGIKIKLN